MAIGSRIIALVCLTIATVQCCCPDGWYRFQSSCYFFELQKQTWHSAVVENNKKQLIEKTEIVKQRLMFYERKKELEDRGFQLVYTDETWLDTSCTKKSCWQGPGVHGVNAPLNKGQFIIVVNAGSRTGFVSGAKLVFKAASSTGDYHGEMDGETFTKWMQERLLPNLTKYCEALHGHLVTLETEDEYKFIKAELLKMNRGVGDFEFWTSGNDIAVEDIWVWNYTSERVTINHWGPGEPSHGTEDCLGLYLQSGVFMMNDAPCDYQTEFICEILLLQFVFLSCSYFVETNAADAKSDLTDYLLGRILTIGGRLDTIEERLGAQNSVAADDNEAIQEKVDAVIKYVILNSQQVSKAFGVEKTNIRAKGEEISHLTNANRNEITRLKVDSNQTFMRMSNLVDVISDVKSQLKSAANQRSRNRKKGENTERQIETISKTVIDIQQELNELKLDTKRMKTALDCPRGWNKHLDSCILYVTDRPRSWAGAQRYCRSKQGKLAEPYTHESLDLLLRNAQDSVYAWFLGARDRKEEGTWIWESSSTPMELNRWVEGEPNNDGNEDCLEVIQKLNSSQVLNDLPCNDKRNFICETESRIRND